jgi:hypothetical protein
MCWEKTMRFFIFWGIPFSIMIDMRSVCLIDLNFALMVSRFKLGSMWFSFIWCTQQKDFSNGQLHSRAVSIFYTISFSNFPKPGFLQQHVIGFKGTWFARFLTLQRPTEVHWAIAKISCDQRGLANLRIYFYFHSLRCKSCWFLTKGLQWCWKFPWVLSSFKVEECSF